MKLSDSNPFREPPPLNVQRRAAQSIITNWRDFERWAECNCPVWYQMGAQAYALNLSRDDALKLQCRTLLALVQQFQAEAYERAILCPPAVIHVPREETGS